MPYFRVAKNYMDDLSNFNVDTVFIRPLKKKSEGGKLRRADILSHFCAFGVVKAIRIRNKPTRLYGFVTFTEIKSAAKALEIEIHTIAGRRVEVTIAYRRHQHRTDLLNLNDNCVFEILERLDMMDLCSIADTSCRLKEIAKRVFRKKQKWWDVIDLLNGEKSAERVFINFGSLMTHLTFSGEDLTNFFDYVTKYCGKALKSVKLYNCFITGNLTIKLRPIFKNLEKLGLDKCYFSGDSKTLLGDCDSLVTLDLSDNDIIPVIIENTFPNLEILRCAAFPSKDLSDYESDDDDEDDDASVLSFDSFVLRHKKLKVLQILKYNITSSVIVNCKLQLELLECRIPADTTFDIPSHDHLEGLGINCNKRNVAESTHGWNKLLLLKRLGLVKANVDSKFVKTLSQLKTLQRLNMFYCTGIENVYRIGNLNQLIHLYIESKINVEIDLVRLTKRLCNLTHLDVMMNGFSVDDKTFWEIVDVVGKRSNESQLNLSFCGKSCNVDQKCWTWIDHFRLRNPLVNIEMLCGKRYSM